MTLDEAIKHAEEVAEEKRCEKCGEEHRRLAEWLKELKQLSETLEIDCIDRAQTQTEIEMNASRYTLSKERGGMGQVEWSDQLIKVSDAVDIIRHLPSVTPARKEEEWIPCDEKLPKPNELVDNVRKYYLIQDEYGDMYVARYTSDEWISIDSILQDNIVAWMPLPEPYKAEMESEEWQDI